MSQFDSRPSSSTRAGPPAIPKTGIPAVDKALDAVRQYIETREGARGNRWEQVVTQRDLQALGLVKSNASSLVTIGTAPGTVMVLKPDGTYASASFEVFSEALRKTQLYQDLEKRLDDQTRFDRLPEEVKALLLPDLAAIAAERGAEITRLEQKIQTERESFAATVTEVTAATQALAAGVRQSMFAYANDTRAVAGSVTQVTARLDGFGGGTASVEEVMTAIADRTDGLEAQWTLKVNAGGAYAAIGVGASSPIAGPSDSHIIFVANNFAFVQPTDVLGTGPGEVDPTNPGASRIPFGIDSDGVIYLNGQVRIAANGQAIQDVANATYIGAFASAPATAGLKKNNFYKNTTDGNTYILTSDAGAWSLWIAKGADGSAGATGPSGLRGSVTAYASGSSWSDATANSAIASYTGTGYKVIGDTVTIANGSSFAATKYWGGSSWLDPGVTIDGNLLVTGTLSASKISGGSITASSIYLAGGNFQVSSSTGAVIAYDFLGVNSRFVNSSNPGVSPLTATSSYNALGTALPAIRAIGYSGGYSVHASGGTIYSAMGYETGSSSMVLNFNADLLDGYHASAFQPAGSYAAASHSHGSLVNGSYHADMQSDGNFVIYNGASVLWDSANDNLRDCDRRLKKLVVDTRTQGMAVIDCLRVRDFYWKKGYARHDPWKHTDLIAQEVRDVIPDAVQERADGMLRYDPAKVVPFLVKALQEKNAEIQQLRADVDRLAVAFSNSARRPGRRRGRSHG